MRDRAFARLGVSDRFITVTVSDQPTLQERMLQRAIMQRVTADLTGGPSGAVRSGRSACGSNT
jgi:hypothetical protein